MTDSFWEKLLSLVFPHKCFCCGEVLAGIGWLCQACKNELPETTGELCLRCGKRAEECICAGLAADSYDRAVIPLYYTGGVSRGIHRYKYDGRSYYAPFLAELLAKQIRAARGKTRFGCITYVPMTRKKQRQRGFCQTELLAEELSLLLDIPVRRDLLLHTGKGGAQMEQKGLDARQRNAMESYTTRKMAVLEGEIVLLVDDVLTTGSTVERCACLLRRKGAGGVWVAAVATTRRKT